MFHPSVSGELSKMFVFLICLLQITETFPENRKFNFLLDPKVNSENPCGQIYLTQSPNKRKNLQLNWNFNCNDPPDTILLTHRDLRLDANATILHKIATGFITKGYHETPYFLPNGNLPGSWSQENPNPDVKPHCFNFYVSAAKNSEILYSQCLSIQPNWMSNFGELRIADLTIPGTHNSGAWRGGPPFIKNYILNQDRNLYEQLVYGIRYFDIRIGRYENGFYINHSFFKCTELLPELLSVEKFLRQSPKEVVIINYYRFPHPKDFSGNYHQELLNLTKSIFGDLIYPFRSSSHRSGPKLNEFWRKSQRLIVSYRNENFVRANPWLWPSVARRWGNKQKVADLESYIKGELSSPVMGNPMNALMAELTPSYYTFIKHITRNLKDLSILVNRELPDWIRHNDGWRHLNIIATDFFAGNDVINVAIESNFKKLNRFYK